MKVLIFATHPIQYQAPIYRALNLIYDLKVIYLLNQTSKQQADSGFGVEFNWDVPLLDGYNHEYLKNHSSTPSSSLYKGIIIDTNELDNLIKKEQPNIVIINGWFPKAFKQILNYCFKKNIKTICRGDSTLLMTNNYLKKLAKEFYIRSILKKFSAFFYVGNENKKYLLHYGVKEQNLYPARHCINTPFFENQFDKINPKEYSSDSIKIGFAGKFIEKKQPTLLLEAINKSNFKDKIVVEFIGDGPLKPTIIKTAKQFGINVNFLGFLNQTEIVPKGYSKIDFLVLPSRDNETWGLVVNEVMTGGIPVIVSSTVGCHSDLVKEGETGFVFESGNANDLSLKIDIMINLLIKDSSKVNLNVKRLIKNYSLNETVNSIKNAIERI